MISLLEHGILKTIKEKELNPETIFDITKVIDNLPSITPLGCEDHYVLLTHRIFTFFLITRMYFICKHENKNDCYEKNKTKQNRKLSKLSYSTDIHPTNNCQNTAAENYNPVDIPIAMKPVRKRKSVMKPKSNNSRKTKRLYSNVVENCNRLNKPVAITPVIEKKHVVSPKPNGSQNVKGAMQSMIKSVICIDSTDFQKAKNVDKTILVLRDVTSNVVNKLQ